MKIINLQFHQVFFYALIRTGRYHISAFSPGYVCNAFEARLFSVTQNKVLLNGSGGYSHSGNGLSTSSSKILGIIEVEKTEILRLEHQHASNSGNSDGTGHTPECVFAQIEITGI